MMNDYLSLQGQENRMKHAIREKEEKRANIRRRSLLYLILEFLRQEGLTDSSETLMKEAHLTTDVRICDNIDLGSILSDYEDYHLSKFNRLPKLIKKVDDPVPWSFQESSNKKEKSKSKRKIEYSDNIPEKGKSQLKVTEDNFGMTVTQISGTCSSESRISEKMIETTKILQPIDSLYPLGSELRDIADSITKEIVLADLNVRWDDILGLNDCKRLLQESITYPIKHPDMFSGKFAPWKGFLLYGPPGTGKTMLARAIATECNCTFFNVTASSLVSKWRGDSEKYVRVLCDLARHQAPSIIFIDEIDWITGDIDATGSSSEPARRFRSELLARLDGLISMEKTNVILLATTNAPWNLDSAMLRRLEKHILIDFPDEDVRRKILEFYTAPILHKQKIFGELVSDTEYYSAADLKQLCKEAWMAQLRTFLSNRGKKGNSPNGKTPPELINSLSLLVEAKNFILPTAKHLAGRYKSWEARNKSCRKH